MSSEAAVSTKIESGSVDAPNSRGIPAAKFIEDVSEYVSTSTFSAETILKQLHSLYGKYKFMESQLVQQQKGLLTKIPDIESALAALRHLQKQDADKEITTHFELSDSIYAKAKIKDAKTVLLWLGANVMLEYEFKEAEELLSNNLKNARGNLASLEKDLSFLKDQITVSEVNIARVHNFRVQQKQEQQAAIKAQQQAAGK